jgi:transcription factor C subunit 7
MKFLPREIIFTDKIQFRPHVLVDPSTGTYTSLLSPTKIPGDPPLTAHGVDQAEQLADHLLCLEPPIEAVYSSPYYRCLRTIEPFVKKRHASRNGDQTSGDSLLIRPEHGLGEWFGRAPFEHPQPASTSVLKPMFSCFDETYQSGFQVPKNGESLEGLFSRVARVLESIIDQCDEQGIKSVVLCTHAAVVIALGRILTGEYPERIDVDDFHAFTCGLSTFRRRKEPANLSSLKDGKNNPADRSQKIQNSGIKEGWLCEANSDCSFLTNGPERGW